MKTIEKNTANPLFVYGSLLLAGMACTQQAVGVETTSKFRLEEIVVTSRRIEEKLQDVPISVSAFNSADIEARGLADLEDIALSVPNVNYSRNNGQGVISIRGFADEELVVTADPLVGVYIDGIYIARMQGALLEMVDAERIEVLKGPQGTLFGKNTVGGAISIISKVPQGDGSGYLKAVAGEDERFNVQGAYDAGITDKLSVRLSGLYKRRDCLVKRVNDNACVDDEDVKLFRANANYQASETFQASLILDGTWDDSHAQVQGVDVIDPSGIFVALYELDRIADPTLPEYDPAGQGKPYVAEGNAPTDDKIRSYGASLQLQWELSDNLTLRSISAYRDHESRAYIEFDAFRETVFQNAPFLTFSDTFSQELILEGESDRVNWLGGLYYFYEDAASQSNLAVAQSFLTGGIRQFINSEVHSISGFGHVSFALTERLKLSGGVRYTSDDREFDSRGDLFATPGANDFVSPVNRKDTFTAWTPKVTLDYKPTDDMLIYGSVSRGFRSGGFNGQTTQSDPRFVTYDPEFVINYELGLKATFWDQRAIFNSAVYLMDYTDKQFSFQEPNPDDLTQVVAVRDNAGEAEVRGIEMDLKIALTDKLKLEAGFAYNDYEYTELDPDLLSTTGISLDSPFLYSPKRTATLSLEYTEPDFAGVGEASFRVDAAYKDRIYFNANVAEINAPVFGRFNYQDAYTKVNARISFRPHDANWSLALYGHNLTDKIIWERNLGTASSGFNTSAYGQPREVGVEARYDF